MMKHLSGVVTAMVTPFHEDGSINIEAMEQITHFLIEKGVSGLFPLGTNGECMRLSVQERKRLAEAVVKAAAGSDVPVFIHTGAVSMEDTLELSCHAKNIGADGIAVVTPPYFKLTERELYAFYKKIANVVGEDFPVYVYNIPQCTGNDISVELMERLYNEVPNIIGIKYSFGDDERTKGYCSIKGLSVLHGADTKYPEMMVLGCDGVVSGLSGAYPEPFVNEVQAYKKKNMEELLFWQKAGWLVSEATDCGNIAYIKYIISQRGIDVGNIRFPALPPTEAVKKIIKSAMREVEAAI